MRWINLKIIMLILLVGLNLNVCTQAQPVEIKSYDINASFNPVVGELQVSADLELSKADSLAEFVIMLNSTVKIGVIRAVVGKGSVKLTYNFAGKDSLHLTLPPELIASRTLTLDFKYTIPISEPKENVVMLDRGNRWYPLIMDQIAGFKLTATVPKGYVTYASGDFVEKSESGRQSRYVWESKIPVFKLPLIIAKSDFYRDTTVALDGKNIIFHYTSVDQETKQKLLVETDNAFGYYSGHIGEYPHNNLTLVEIPGMEGTDIASGLLMIGSKSMEGFKQGYYDELLLSIACQWMASGVFFKYQGKGFWFLQLSLPHYLRLMYIKQAHGMMAFTQNLKTGLEAYKGIAGTEKEVSIMDVDLPNTKEKATAIYGKGPYVIDLVQKQIGDENWEKFLRDIYQNFLGKILTYDEFVSYLSKYDKDGTAVANLNKILSEKGIPEEK